MNKQPAFDPERLFFLDETNANTRMHRPYGRGPIGERVPDTNGTDFVLSSWPTKR